MSATTLPQFPADMTADQRSTWSNHARNIGPGAEITAPWMADNTLFGRTAYYEVSAGMGAVVAEYGIRPNGDRFLVV